MIEMQIELSWALTAILTIINAVGGIILLDFKKRLRHLEAGQMDMKLNYIARFQEAQGERSTMESKLLTALAELKLENAVAHGKLHQETLDNCK